MRRRFLERFSAFLDAHMPPGLWKEWLAGMDEHPLLTFLLIVWFFVRPLLLPLPAFWILISGQLLTLDKWDTLDGSLLYLDGGGSGLMHFDHLKLEQKQAWSFSLLYRLKAGDWHLGMALVAVLLCAWFWVYYRRRSKSIYLMRRLPDGREPLRRFWTVPILLVLLGLFLSWLFCSLEYLIYILRIPRQYQAPGTSYLEVLKLFWRPVQRP